MRIATLLTSHNRRSKTIASLEGVFSQKLPDGCTMEVFLVDDGSDDGTGEAVRHRFPRVHLLEGTGELFWSGGMRMAFTEALKGDYDFYWWVNDDTQLSSDALDRMVQTYFTLTERSERPPVIVGSVCDPQSGELTY
ncbi:MAG TPA: glycosyltransferase family 2 protein, partial [Phycisphaerae bacterium]|nr:glycosyltransferase family 2 protein [Phycisphaerae bacterium]